MQTTFTPTKQIILRVPHRANDLPLGGCITWNVRSRLYSKVEHLRPNPEMPPIQTVESADIIEVNSDGLVETLNDWTIDGEARAAKCSPAWPRD